MYLHLTPLSRPGFPAFIADERLQAVTLRFGWPLQSPLPANAALANRGGGTRQRSQSEQARHRPDTAEFLRIQTPHVSGPAS